MNPTALHEVPRSAENWSAEDQAELVRAAQYIELRKNKGFDLTASDWKVIEARLEAARLGAVARDDEVAAVFRKYRAA